LEAEVNLVRDLLDKLVVDRNGRELGRVDGIVLDESDRHRPSLTAILIGPSALGYRLHPFIGRCVAAVEHVFGIDAGRPTRIEAGDILQIADAVKVNQTAGETQADALDRKLRGWLARIPGKQ
jgi:sporulation protein YlmC with PRC-barrel domain